MEDRLLSLIPEYLPLGLVVYDKEGHLKYANGIAFRMFGVTMEEVSGINILRIPTLRTKTRLC